MSELSDFKQNIVRRTKIKIRCPNCKKEFQIPVENTGKAAKCDNCWNIFIAEEIDNKEFYEKIVPRIWTPPNNEYLKKCGGTGIVLAAIVLIASIDNNDIISITAFLTIFICIGLIGLGTLIRAINANTEEIKRQGNESIKSC